MITVRECRNAGLMNSLCSHCASDSGLDCCLNGPMIRPASRIGVARMSSLNARPYLIATDPRGVFEAESRFVRALDGSAGGLALLAAGVRSSRVRGGSGMGHLHARSWRSTMRGSVGCAGVGLWQT